MQSKYNKTRQGLSAVRPDESSSPRKILKSMLLPDEKILLIGEVSGGIYWKSIAVLCVAALFMLLMVSFGLPSQLLLLFGGALTIKVVLMFTVAILRKHYLLLAATDKRIIIRVGILNLEIIQLRYAQVESSEVASTIPGRFLGYSSVFISGTGGHTLAIPFIVNAMEFRKTVTEILSRRDDAEVH
jgi:hypothetical protein